MKKSTRARRRKPDTAKTDLQPPSGSPSEDRVSTARWNLKGLRRTTGSYSMGAIPPRNRSAQVGEWSSLQYGGEGGMVPPQRTMVCAGDTVEKRQRRPRET